MNALDIQRHAMFKPIARMAAAATVAGLFVFLTSAAPESNVADAKQALSQDAKGTACSRHGWPEFEPSCQFDLRKPASAARSVRVLGVR